MEFESFEKIARLNRGIVVTEKIDGTNAQIAFTEDMEMFVGSRKRWITPDDDNFGFAKWAHENAEDLKLLGPGRHYGEWWGSGIQRRYGMDKKVFSLFNTGRWSNERPDCCDLVPLLYAGHYSEHEIKECLTSLETFGSRASQGFMNPEGVIVYHAAARKLFKVTIKNDEKPKGSNEAG